MIGLHPYWYFQDAWNCFDAVIVSVSLLEFPLQGQGGLSVLRTFRLVSEGTAGNTVCQSVLFVCEAAIQRWSSSADKGEGPLKMLPSLNSFIKIAKSSKRFARVLLAEK